MVDTVRTLAALQALLADNTDQDISAQDVRDFLVSAYTGPVLLDSATITGSDATISITGINQTFDHLLLRALVRSDAAQQADSIAFQVGPSGGLDTGTNYNYEYFSRGDFDGESGSSGAAQAGQSGADNVGAPCVGNSGAAGAFGMLEIEFPFYSSITDNRQMFLRGGGSDTGNSRMFLGTAKWVNTADAIEQIGLTPALGTNFKVGSKWWLYGIRTPVLP